MFLGAVNDPGTSTGDAGLVRARRDASSSSAVVVEITADLDGTGPGTATGARDLPVHLAVFC
jgi:hypothetical protein